LEVANNKFSFVERISRDEWPMPAEMSVHINLLEDLMKKNIISYNKKFGMLIYYTDIYVAYNKAK
jgi:hypothetical protein